MGFQAATQLGAIATMIKNHEKYPLQYSVSFGISCLELAARQLMMSCTARPTGSGATSSIV
jgi:hypothetical protein